MAQSRRGRSRRQHLPAEFRWVGARVPRVNGAAIVTGRAKYIHDLSFEGMLHARILRSPHASAEIISIDISRAEALPGVKAALKLKEGRVRYEGEPIAAVAAVDLLTAEEALKLIKVEYKELPHVVSAEAGMAATAPQVHDTPNVQKFNEFNRGDIGQGFMAAEVTIERTYRTSFEIHQPLETHSSVAWWKDGELTVWDSTQAVHQTRDQLARMLNIPAGKLRVICQYMGGGFGSKLGANEHTAAAARLSEQTGRPVKVVLSRKENSLCVGNRPSTIITIKGGAKKDGTLTALHMKNITSGGVGRGDRSSTPLTDIYKCPNVKVEEQTVFINAGGSRPTRAPGHVQGTFALEGFMEELAAELGMDPLELRRKNYTAARQGQPDVPYSSKGLDQCYSLGAEKIGWERRNTKPGAGTGRKKRGLGVATQIWAGAGTPGTMATVKVHPDGSVEAICGTQDIGCGTRTFMAAVAADTLGLEPKDITVKIGDTTHPWAPNSGGSQTAPSVAPALRDAALKAAAWLKEIAAKKLEVPAAGLVLAGGKIFDKANPAKSIGLAEILREQRREAVFHGERGDLPAGFAYNSFGAHFAEVEVDTETGQIRVLKVAAAHEVGRVLNRLTAESQVAGGITQGLSAGLFEERVTDEYTGKMLNKNLEMYKVATAADIPEVEFLFVDHPDPRINIMGDKGLGEPPRIPSSAAIANAVFNALGVHPGELPMTPDRVLQALATKEAGR